MTIWYAWVTTTDESFAEAMCAKLVRRGYTVGALGGVLITRFDGNPSAVVSVQVSRVKRATDEKDYTYVDVHAEITDIIRHVKGKFSSLIVTAVNATTGCTWNVGNERDDDGEKLKLELAKKVN